MDNSVAGCPHNMGQPANLHSITTTKPPPMMPMEIGGQLQQQQNGTILAQQCGQNSSSSSSSSHAHHHHHQQSHPSSQNLSRVKSLDTCRVCGDGPARMHYGVPTCFGCKGFFRRTLKRTKEYTCRYSGNCVVDRYERNSCRFCRFKRCLEVGMDPKAVRPDRDAAGRSHPVRRRISRNQLIGGTVNATGGTENGTGTEPTETVEIGGTDEWVRKLPVEMRTLLMQIMNIEAMVHHGDTHESPQNLYPLTFSTIGQMFEDPTCMDGKRTEIRYEPYRQVEPHELTYLAHRRLLATVDTIDHLCALMDLHNTRDKLILTKAAYAPLTLFCAIAATARVTRSRDILCLCNYGYVPRGAHLSYAEPYHFANRLVDRALDELVEPFRTFNFKEQEIVLMKAIVALNPYLPSLSTEAAEQVADFRDRIQETLYNVVRESHPKEVASSRFGNLLLFLPNIMILGSIMIENLQFIQSFRHLEIGPLLNELLDDIEPVQDHGISIDDVLSMSSSSGGENEQSIRYSQSSGSISSLISGGGCGGSAGPNQSQSCDNLATFHNQQSSQHNHQQQPFSSPNLRSSVPDLNNYPNDHPHGGSSSSNLIHSQMSSNDSDPDYNVTLTAESLRHAIHHQQQQMEVDTPPPLEPQQHLPPPILSSLPAAVPIQQTKNAGGTCCQRPQFFIDPSTTCFATCNQTPPQMPQQLQESQQQQQQTFGMSNNCGGGVVEQQQQQQMKTMTTVASTRHVFTVEKSPLAPCCRQRSGTDVGKCQNDECPAALAAIFYQEQQQKLLRQQLEEYSTGDASNRGSFFVHMSNQHQQSEQQQISGSNSSLSKSQSYPHFDTMAFSTGSSPTNGGPGGSSEMKMTDQLGGGMPYSASHDNFHQY